MAIPTSAATGQARPSGVSGLSLRIDGLGKSFPGGIAALEKVTLDVPAGQFLSILGPSGCGKSTLLRIVAGLDVPTSGSVAVDGHATLRNTRPQVGYVFQDAHLLPWRNLLRNVELPLELIGTPRAARRAAAEAALEQVGLADALRRYPAQLSGGMRMRASLARAMVIEPRLLLLDEPFAALDEITRQQLDEQLRALWARRRMTVVFVTHSLAEATFLSERAVVLSRRPGRVALDRTLDLPFDRPGELRTDVRFAREMRDLYAALNGAPAESGSAA